MPTDKGSLLKQRLIGNESSDDIMLLIMETFTETVLIPEVGKYYTFVYKPKTPNVQYDEYPLIACTGIEKWGFKGLNFHWGEIRFYTWAEVVGYLHVIDTTEIKSVRSLSYAKLNINN